MLYGREDVSGHGFIPAAKPLKWTIPLCRRPARSAAERTEWTFFRSLF